jgi:2-dehydro-3-deoxygluconokinase
MTGVLTVGEALGVLAPTEVGRVRSGTRLDLRVAGSEVNVAIALARLRVPVWFAGAVGDDPVGQAIRDTLASQTVHIEWLHFAKGRPTGLLLKEWYGLRPEPRVFYYRRHTAMHEWDADGLEPRALPVDWLHLSGITLMLGNALADKVVAFVNRWCASGLGGMSIDLNIRRRLAEPGDWLNQISRVLPKVSVVFASRSELIDLWGTDRQTDLIRVGALRPEQVLVVTAGDQGAWAEQDGQELGRTMAWPVPRVVDVVGAGDGFVGGVLSGLYHGWSWPDSLRLGALVGALAVAHPGDWEGYPWWDEAMALWEDRWLER